MFAIDDSVNSRVLVAYEHVGDRAGLQLLPNSYNLLELDLPVHHLEGDVRNGRFSQLEVLVVHDHVEDRAGLGWVAL